MRLGSTCAVIALLVCASHGASAAEWSGTISCGDLQNSPNAKSTTGFSGPATLRIVGSKAVFDRAMKEGQEHLEGTKSKGMPLQLEGQGSLYARVDRPWKVRMTLTEKGSGYEGSAVLESLDGQTRYRDCSILLTGTGSSESSQPAGQSSVTIEPLTADASTRRKVPEQGSENSQAPSRIPKHLELARELVATVKPENNKYVLNHGSGVRWKGDLFTSENSVNTACGGFVAAVMERAGNTSIDVVKSKTNSHILRVKQFLESVENDWGFSKISRIDDILPGDLFLFRCNDRCAAAETNNFLGHKIVTEVDAAGHVTIVDIKPTQKKPTPPLIDGTQQWLVTVIDSSEGPHDLKDTRWRAKNEPQVTGVGRGTYRVYTGMDGVPVGYTNGPNGQKLHTIKDRPIIIGRPSASK